MLLLQRAKTLSNLRISNLFDAALPLQGGGQYIQWLPWSTQSYFHFISMLFIEPLGLLPGHDQVTYS